MKKFFCLAIYTIFLYGCSSPATETKVNGNSPSNTATVVNSDAVNAEVTANTNQPYVRGTMINKNSRDEMLAGKGQSGAPPEPIIPTAESTPQSAPDNSEITSLMDAKGQMIDTRTFKNNPVLAKIERNVTDAKNPQVKVYLKNGKVINLPPGKLANPTGASASEILIAAGLAPKAAPPKNAPPGKEKTEQ